MAKKNRKETIFDVSIDLFSQYGYDRVSIRQIAREVGIKESSIYNHYPSKESILEEILNYYISEMLKEEAPLMQPSDNLDLGFDYFYQIGSERFISKLSEEKMMKITRIFLVESYHNEKINKFLKNAIIGYAIEGWVELFDLMKEKNVIKKDSNSRQLAESFYYYGLFLLYEHFIINYPADDQKFIKDFVTRTTSHMKIIYNSVKTDEETENYNSSKIDEETENYNSSKIDEETEIHNSENTYAEKTKGESIAKINEKHEEDGTIIRLEEPKDHRKVEILVRNAFWNVYRPGAYEHYIVHELRKDSSLIKDLAYIIEENEEPIGHINYSKGQLNLYKENRYGVETKLNEGSKNATVLGPIAIAPEYQRQGYGSRLIEYTLNLAQDKNIPFVLVIGDENYYGKFGFESASKYNLFLDGTDPNEENPFFMVKIFDNSFENEDYDKGIFYNPEVFNVDEEKIDEFDKSFEYKEKKVLEGQL